MMLKFIAAASRLPRVLAATLALSLFVSHASANGVTTLMLMPMWHLFLLNLFLGIAEGLALANAGVRGRRAVPIMVLANYFSAWIGLLYLGPVYWLLRATLFKDDPFFNVHALLATMIAISLVGSVICELPFVLRAAKGAASSRRRVLSAYGLAQLATHAAVSLIYISVSNLSLLGGMRHEPDPATLASHLQGWVYYVSTEGKLCRIRLDGTSNEPVTDGPPLVPDWHQPRPYWLPSADDVSWDLHIRDNTPIIRGVRGRPGLFHDHNFEPPGPPVAPNLYAADLREPDARPWRIFVWSVTERGLQVGETNGHGFVHTGQRFGFGIPFEMWSPQMATVLPGNVIVAGFRDISERTDDRIILIDPDGKRVALLTRGAGPVVMLDE